MQRLYSQVSFGLRQFLLFTLFILFIDKDSSGGPMSMCTKNVQKLVWSQTGMASWGQDLGVIIMKDKKGTETCSFK